VLEEFRRRSKSGSAAQAATVRFRFVSGFFVSGFGFRFFGDQVSGFVSFSSAWATENKPTAAEPIRFAADLLP
jgi:hypothetical protein